MSFVGTAVLGSVGAVASIYGAQTAAQAQEQAAQTAAQAQEQAAQTAANTQLTMFNTGQADLKPYIDLGNTAGSQLSSRLSSLTSPITMDESTLENTPGYQFNLTQGLKATQNSAAARGLGISGAALKGASTFATGLADSTYQNQFSNANTNQTNAYNRLAGLVNTGANAAAGAANNANTAGNNIAQTQIGAGNAAAAASNTAGTAAANAANSTGSALSNLSNNIAGYSAYKGLYGNSGAVNANGSIFGAVGPTSVGGNPLVG